MENETKGVVISEEEDQEFERVHTTAEGPTSPSLKKTAETGLNYAAETTNRVLEALKDFPEKLFALIALIGFILVSFSGNMKDWKNLWIFLVFLVFDIGFLMVYEKFFNKEK